MNKKQKWQKLLIKECAKGEIICGTLSIAEFSKNNPDLYAALVEDLHATNHQDCIDQHRKVH